MYSDWCHESEKYKLAMKTWERKQAVSICLVNGYSTGMTPSTNVRSLKINGLDVIQEITCP